MIVLVIVKWSLISNPEAHRLSTCCQSKDKQSCRCYFCLEKHEKCRIIRIVVFTVKQTLAVRKINLLDSGRDVQEQGNVLKLNSGYVPSRSVTSFYFPRGCNERRQSETQHYLIYTLKIVGNIWDNVSTQLNKIYIKGVAVVFCFDIYSWSHIIYNIFKPLENVSLKNIETFSHVGLMTDLSWVFSVRYKLLFHLRLATSMFPCRLKERHTLWLNCIDVPGLSISTPSKSHNLTFAGSLLRLPRAEKYHKGQAKCWHELIWSVMLASNALFFPLPSPPHHLRVYGGFFLISLFPNHI